MWLIDADNLVDELEELADSYVDSNLDAFTRGVYNICRQQGVDAAIEVVKKQKPVDAVKHGRWIYVGAHNGVHLFECSLCHCGLNTENPDWLSKYCSGCGAKMEVNTND